MTMERSKEELERLARDVIALNTPNTGKLGVGRLEKMSRIAPPTCDIFYQTVIAFLLNTVFIT